MLRTHVDALSELAAKPTGMARQRSEPGVRVVAKSKSKAKTAIYHPPKKGMPFLVVTVSPEGAVAIAVESKEEARVLASKKSLRVLLEDDRAEQLS
jgi:hypothetical protein